MWNIETFWGVELDPGRCPLFNFDAQDVFRWIESEVAGECEGDD
jgi:hypothetical protein